MTGPHLHLEAAATHVPCCSTHGEPMTCARYRRTHFVEVRPCCSIDAAALALEAPSPPPPCPVCGGLMGDGDRVHHGRCSVCHLVGRHPSPARCWCGRRVSTLPDGNGIECSEHDL